MSNGTKPEFQPLEAGDYLVRMNRYTEDATKNGKGRMISAGFEVVSGEAKGRLIFHNFLVQHSNPKAQEIGTQQLDNYLKAVGSSLDDINSDTTLLEQWTEIPFIAKVDVKEPEEYKAADGTTKTSKARNVIKKFMAR